MRLIWAGPGQTARDHLVPTLCQALYMRCSQPGQLLLSPVLPMRKARSERLSNLPEATQLVCREAWI